MVNYFDQYYTTLFFPFFLFLWNDFTLFFLIVLNFYSLREVLCTTLRAMFFFFSYVRVFS